MVEIFWVQMVFARICPWQCTDFGKSGTKMIFMHNFSPLQSDFLEILSFYSFFFLKKPILTSRWCTSRFQVSFKKISKKLTKNKKLLLANYNYAHLDPRFSKIYARMTSNSCKYDLVTLSLKFSTSSWFGHFYGREVISNQKLSIDY